MHLSSCLRHFYAGKLNEATLEELQRHLAEAEASLAEVEEEQRLLTECTDATSSQIAAMRRYLEEDEWHFRARLAAIRDLLDGSSPMESSE